MGRYLPRMTDMPPAHPPPAIERPAPRIVNIRVTPDGRIYVDGRLMTVEEMDAWIKTLPPKTPTRPTPEKK